MASHFVFACVDNLPTISRQRHPHQHLHRPSQPKTGIASTSTHAYTTQHCPSPTPPAHTLPTNQIANARVNAAAFDEARCSMRLGVLTLG